MVQFFRNLGLWLFRQPEAPAVADALLTPEEVEDLYGLYHGIVADYGEFEGVGTRRRGYYPSFLYRVPEVPLELADVPAWYNPARVHVETDITFSRSMFPRSIKAMAKPPFDEVEQKWPYPIPIKVTIGPQRSEVVTLLYPSSTILRPTAEYRRLPYIQQIPGKPVREMTRADFDAYQVFALRVLERLASQPPAA
ncbi:MAG: hypothetical protein HYY37_05720 [Candidatus Aenigmarchaeota archaeon]|nr:hypothetical protein [Candidatus Aenigmarchaeota archaeon]